MCLLLDSLNLEKDVYSSYSYGVQYCEIQELLQQV
jgi:hypothetical protein